MYTDHNLTMLTDLYQLTMMQGYFKYGKTDKVSVFDLFFRENPFHAAFSVTAGLDQLIEYIKNLHFSYDDIAYLESTGIFDEDFLTLFFLRGKITSDFFFTMLILYTILHKNY